MHNHTHIRFVSSGFSLRVVTSLLVSFAPAYEITQSKYNILVCVLQLHTHAHTHSRTSTHTHSLSLVHSLAHVNYLCFDDCELTRLYYCLLAYSSSRCVFFSSDLTVAVASQLCIQNTRSSSHTQQKRTFIRLFWRSYHILHTKRVSEWASESETIVVRVSFFIRENNTPKSITTSANSEWQQQQKKTNTAQNTAERPKIYVGSDISRSCMNKEKSEWIKFKCLKIRNFVCFGFSSLINTKGE